MVRSCGCTGGIMLRTGLLQTGFRVAGFPTVSSHNFNSSNPISEESHIRIHRILRSVLIISIHRILYPKNPVSENSQNFKSRVSNPISECIESCVKPEQIHRHLRKCMLGRISKLQGLEESSKHVCMYVYIYIYIYVFIYLCIHTHVQILYIFTN